MYKHVNYFLDTYCMCVYVYIHNKYTQFTYIHIYNVKKKLLFWMRLIAINRLAELVIRHPSYFPAKLFNTCLFVCICLYLSRLQEMEHKGNSWHETCFTCHRCQQPIGTKSFIPKDNNNYCVALLRETICTAVCAMQEGIEPECQHLHWIKVLYMTLHLYHFLSANHHWGRGPTMTSHGIRTASCVLAVSSSSLASASPLVKTLPIVSTASAICMPRSALPAPPLLAVWDIRNEYEMSGMRHI